MPRTDLHKKKLKKNLAILALIFLWVAVIWAVTMIRIAGAQEPVGGRWTGRNYSGIDIKSKPVDVKGPMYENRYEHMQNTSATKESWDAAYHENAEERQATKEDNLAQRDAHREHTRTSKDRWDEAYRDAAPERLDREAGRDENRDEHLNESVTMQHQWHQDWQARQQEQP